MTATIGTVYLLHITRPGGLSPRHYIGWTTDLAARLDRHQRGQGSVMIRELLRQGATLTVGRIWMHHTRADEHRLKQQHHHARMCYVCRPAALAAHAAAERRRRRSRIAPNGGICYATPAPRV